jgi:membrane associated rhomboid family serine protease
MIRLSPVVRNLIIINVVVFILQQLLTHVMTREIGGQEITLSFEQLIALWDVRFPLFQPYQFFTYMFAHGGIMHLLFNMLTLASIAPILEEYWGDKRFLIFYMATGIGAGVVYALVNLFLYAPSNIPMVGASGAIYGVLMAFGLTFPNMQVSMLFVPMPAKYLVFVIGLLTYFIDRSGAVAHAAHFGGALIGFILVSIWRVQGRR